MIHDFNREELYAGFADGDAISRESRELRDVFGKMGFSCALYAEDGRISPTMADVCRPLSEYRGEPSDLVL